MDWTQALDDFGASGVPGVWPQIDKAELLADMRTKISWPVSTNQGDLSPLCGPAAIVYELTARDPLAYVRLCRTLFETGVLAGLTRSERPSTQLLASAVRADLTPADWMLMASMRETENAIFRVDAESGDVALGITTPWEMKGWTRELLSFPKASYTSTYFWGEAAAIKRAQAVRDAGGVAFLMITAALLDPAHEPFVAIPNHWVSFLGGLRIEDGMWWRWDSGHVNFDCYSWASQRSVNVGEGPFEDYTWGVVYGER